MVALENKQEYGVDYEKTFAPVVKIITVRTIIVIVASQGWPIHQMNIKNVFLYSDLKKNIYETSIWFVLPLTSVVCNLKRSLYGLKQAPRVWFNKF